VKTGLLTWFLGGAVVMGGAAVHAGSPPESRIIGGESALPSESEFFAALMYKDVWGDGSDEFHWKPFCGASYIGDGLILTAAHCISSIEMKVWLGDPGNNMGYQVCGQSSCSVTDVKPVKDDVRAALFPSANSLLLDINTTNSVRDVYIHKEFNPNTYENDIALIRLDSVPTSEAVQLPQSNDYPQLATSGEEVTVLGLGDTTYNSEIFHASKDLLKVDLPAVSNSACSGVYSNFNSDVMVCAGYLNGMDGSDIRKDSCQGDSGGPLVRSTGTGYVQYGIVSFGFLCAETYGVYSSVYGLNYWINALKAYWLGKLDFDWQVDFGTSEEALNKSLTWTFSNNSENPVAIGSWDFNSLSSGFSVGTNECQTTLAVGDKCEVTFIAGFNSIGSYSGRAFFTAEGAEYELRFSASVTEKPTEPKRFGSTGGSTGLLMLILLIPLVLLRATKLRWPLLVLPLIGMSACTTSPVKAGSHEVVFNPSVNERGLEFSVVSSGCTEEMHVYLRVRGDEIEVRRTQEDMCRMAPHLVRFMMPLPEGETVWTIQNPVRYSNRTSGPGIPGESGTR